MSAPSERPSGGAHEARPAAAARTRPFYWSVRREVWENRSIYIAPLLVAGVALFAFFISVVTLAHRMGKVALLDPAKQHRVGMMPYSVAVSMILLTGFIVGLFYCVDALNSERRDRSILFWKSMPVSDRTTVLSKAAIPLLVLPLLTCTVALAAQSIMFVLGTAVRLGSHGAPLSPSTPFFQSTVVMLYGLTVHTLWYAPLYAWLLLLSAWTRRATFLWAVLPCVVIAVAERVVFGTADFVGMFRYRLFGAMTEAFAVDARRVPINSLSELAPLKFLSTSGLWIGLALTVVFLAAAVRLRRYRQPI